MPLIIAVIVNYAGQPVVAFESVDDANARANEMNEMLNPWERNNGYFYSVSSLSFFKKQ